MSALGADQTRRDGGNDVSFADPFSMGRRGVRSAHQKGPGGDRGQVNKDLGEVSSLSDSWSARRRATLRTRPPKHPR